MRSARCASVVSDRTWSLTALRSIAALDAGLARGDPGLSFAEKLEELADLQRRFGRLRAAINARTEGVVLFI